MISSADLVTMPSTLAAAEASFFMKVVENSIWVGIAVCAFVGMYSGIMLMRRVKQKQFPGVEAEQTFLADLGTASRSRTLTGLLKFAMTRQFGIKPYRS